MTALPRLIGIGGAAGAGKDTAADYIADRFGLIKRPFAFPLYVMADALLGTCNIKPRWHDREWKEGVMPEFGFSPRRLLQTLGTEWGQSLDKRIWVKALARFWAVVETSDLPGLVIPDVRFPREAQWILDNGGVLIRIERPGTQPVAKHSSEQMDWEDWPHAWIFNNGSIEKLENTVEKAVQAHPHWNPQ